MLAAFEQADPASDLALCWRIQDCGSCLASPNNCAWCPYSSACVALPDGGNLFSPIRKASICPLWQERWELRTSTFGCNCSTTTFLVALITCAATLVSLVLLWGTVKALTWTLIAIRQSRAGWALEEDQDGERTEGPWIREPKTWTSWLKTKFTRSQTPDPFDREVEEQEREALLG